MSEQLLVFAKTFLSTESDAEIFANEFMDKWKLERESYEFDEFKLRHEMNVILKKMESTYS